MLKKQGLVWAVAPFAALALAPQAEAAPAFPDLDGYAEADDGAYSAGNGFHQGYLFFSGPGGVRCQITWGEGHPTTVGAPSCWGALPGAQGGANAVSTQGGEQKPTPAVFVHENDLARKYETWNQAVTENGETSFKDAPIPAEKFVPLAAGQKLTHGDGWYKTTCAVTNDGAIACAEYTASSAGDTGVDYQDYKPTHGFVLSPEGSTVF